MDWLLSNVGVEILATIVIAVSLLAWRVLARLSRRVVRRPLLIFVSTGGTCRDPMAKAIADKIFSDNGRKIDVVAVGVGEITSDHASKPAQHVISQMLGEDVLKNHRPRKLTRELADSASLILGMTQSHVETIKKVFPSAQAKVHLLKRYFGKEGDVEDPYRNPDEMTAEALTRYRACAEELRDILDGNKEHLLAALA